MLFTQPLPHLIASQYFALLLSTSPSGISERYEGCFIEIGTDRDHRRAAPFHFLIQTGLPGGVARQSPKQVSQLIKRLTDQEVFRQHPHVKKMLWGGKAGIT